MTKSKLTIGIIIVLSLILFVIINPFSYNEAGFRTVVTQTSGKQFVQYNAGTYYSGFFAKEDEWPNQISVSYKEDADIGKMEDNNIDIGRVQIRFNDATTAGISGITQYILPSDEKEMIEMHNAHKNPEALVKRRLSPYTKESLQSSAQLMSSEMHYGGGRAQMAQDYLDQLKNGVFLLSVKEVNLYDSIEKENRKLYQTQIQKDKDGFPKRKFSSIKEYGITVADAQITDVDYEEKVDNMLAKKIDAATKASISKQDLMTAQQQALTEAAKGEQKLVEIKYKQMQEQTNQVVAAQTLVEVAKQDLEKQSVQEKAAVKEANKIKILADADAYAKRTAIQANGSLEQKLDAYVQVQKFWADAFAKYQGNVVPTYQTGGANGNGGLNFMEIMGAKAARDLSLDLKTK